MDKITHGGISGRKPRLKLLEDGSYAVIKKMFKTGNGYAIYLPTEWLALLDSKGKLKESDYQFTLWYDNEKLIIQPLESDVVGSI